jgi:hypothetical protein
VDRKPGNRNSTVVVLLLNNGIGIKETIMKNKKYFLYVGLFVLSILLISVTGKLGTANAGIPETEDTKEIEAVIQKSYDLEAKAAYNFDTSQFASVFINDSRVKLDPSTQKFVESVKVKLGQDTQEEYGFLDYKMAYFEKWEADALQVEAIQANADQEKRELTSDEMIAMANSMHRATGPEKKATIIFYSIKQDGDMATAVFDDGPRLNEMKLVKIKGSWLIAGWTILQVHA